MSHTRPMSDLMMNYMRVPLTRNVNDSREERGTWNLSPDKTPKSTGAQYNPQSYKDIMKRIVGYDVVTGYNNNTYRIEEIAFKKTLMDTFDLKSGVVPLRDQCRAVRKVEAYIKLDIFNRE